MHFWVDKEKNLLYTMLIPNMQQKKRKELSVLNFDKLKGLMREKKITQENLALKLNISLQSLNSKLNGKSSFTLDEVRILISYLEIKDIKAYFFSNSIPNMQ